ncbi:hypothetical protein NX059_008655 [Plenodomus lindquistii]|nr:hypothetical protein NX059_008655 [Plenodomus lindquistii]
MARGALREFHQHSHSNAIVFSIRTQIHWLSSINTTIVKRTIEYHSFNIPSHNIIELTVTYDANFRLLDISKPLAELK